MTSKDVGRNPIDKIIAEAPALQTIENQKILDALPGLVGGLDRALFDVSGRAQPFVVLIFAEGQAMHAANFGAREAMDAVKTFAGIISRDENAAG